MVIRHKHHMFVALSFTYFKFYNSQTMIDYLQTDDNNNTVFCIGERTIIDLVESFLSTTRIKVTTHKSTSSQIFTKTFCRLHFCSTSSGELCLERREARSTALNRDSANLQLYYHHLRRHTRSTRGMIMS